MKSKKLLKVTSDTRLSKYTDRYRSYRHNDILECLELVRDELTEEQYEMARYMFQYNCLNKNKVCNVLHILHCEFEANWKSICNCMQKFKNDFEYRY